MTRHATPAIDYIRRLYAPQDTLLERIDNRLKSLDMDIHIGADEGKLLQLLIALGRVKTIVEIGTLAGYSTLWMARALPDDGHIYTLEKDARHMALAKEFFAQSDVKDRITLLEGDAQASLLKLADDPAFTKTPLDMVFIDADKINYNHYLDWAERHVQPGGLIVADNTFLFDTVWLDAPPPDVAPATWHAMRRFNERLANQTNYASTIIPTQEGLSAAIKRF